MYIQQHGWALNRMIHEKQTNKKAQKYSYSIITLVQIKHTHMKQYILQAYKNIKGHTSNTLDLMPIR